jgi:hypothetical protein
MYAYLDKNFAAERKPRMTDEQFYYKTRKNAIGPFKADLWGLAPDSLDRIGQAWERQFDLLFDQLNIADTEREVKAHVAKTIIHPSLESYLRAAGVTEAVGDLAD